MTIMAIINRLVDVIILTSFIVGIVLFWGTQWANFCFVLVIFSTALALSEVMYKMKENKK